MSDSMLPFTTAGLRAIGAVHPRPAPVVDSEDAAAFERLLVPTRQETTQDGARSVSAFTCLPEHLQETHIVFGGLQAMLHETAANAAVEQMLDGPSPPILCSMGVTYLAGAKLGDELEAHVTSATGWGSGGAVATSKLRTAGSSGTSGIRSDARLAYVAAAAST